MIKAIPEDDGGQAFPVYDGTGWMPGMTLLEFYAGQALAGLLSGRPDADCGSQGYASDAFIYAEAMIAEKRGREKQQGGPETR